MKFNSKSGQEVRTWTLFIVGVALVFIFAWQRNPLNPWWTLIIGAFTCTAIIVSAVQALVGGMTDAARRAVEEARRSDTTNRPEETDEASFSTVLGDHGFGPLRWIRRHNTVAVQPHFQ